MNYFSAISVFHKAVETGNFSATARELGMAVSSVARQIDALEDRLGVALFNRSTRHMSLTHAGERYYQQTRHILDDLHFANQSAKNLYSKAQGRLRISLPVAYGELVLAPMLQEFQRRYPDIHLEIDFSETIVDVVNDHFDLAVRLGLVNDQRLIARILTRHERWLCASPAYLQRHPAPADPDDLAHHNCLSFLHQGFAPKWYFYRGQDARVITVSGNLRCNNGAMLKKAVKSGQGVCMLSDWLIRDEVASGELIRLLPDYQIMPTPSRDPDAVYAVYPPTVKGQYKLRLLLEFLQERFALPDGGDGEPSGRISLRHANPEGFSRE